MPSAITSKSSSNAKVWGVPTGKRSAIPRSSSAPRAPLANKPLNISSPVTAKPTVSGNPEKKLPGTPSRLPRAKSGPVSVVPSRGSSPPPRPPRAPDRLGSLPLATKATTITTTTPPKPLLKDFTSSRTLSAKNVLTPTSRSASATSLRTPAKTPLSRDFSSSRTLSATKLLSTPTTSSSLGAAASYHQSTESIVSRARNSVSPPSSGTRPRSPISRASSSSPPARELKFAARLRADRSAHAIRPITVNIERAPEAPEPIVVKEEPKVELKEEIITTEIKSSVITVEEKKTKVEEIKEAVVEEIKKINVEESKQSEIVEIKKINVEGTESSIIEEIKKIQYPIASEEEKITEGLRSWSPDAAVPDSMVVTELVQTTHGVVRVQRYIIAEEEEMKPRIVVRSKWWSFGMLGKKSCH